MWSSVRDSTPQAIGGADVVPVGGARNQAFAAERNSPGVPRRRSEGPRPLPVPGPYVGITLQLPRTIGNSSWDSARGISWGTCIHSPLDTRGAPQLSPPRRPPRPGLLRGRPVLVARPQAAERRPGVTQHRGSATRCPTVPSLGAVAGPRGRAQSVLSPVLPTWNSRFRSFYFHRTACSGKGV